MFIVNLLSLVLKFKIILSFYQAFTFLAFTLVIKSWLYICFIEIVFVRHLPQGIIKNYSNLALILNYFIL